MRQKIADLQEQRRRPRRTASNRAAVARLRRTAVYTRSTDATYGVHVRDGDDYPNDWARFLRAITNRPGWSVARLARDAGIHRATIFRWLKGDVRNITLDSVRLVAEAANVDYAVALQAASTLVLASVEADGDTEIEMIRAEPAASDAEKAELIEHVRQRRLQLSEQLRQEIEMLLRPYRRRASGE